MLIVRLKALLLVVAVISLPACADEAADKMTAAKKVIEAKLLSVNKSYKVSSIMPAGLEGFYRVQLESGPALYVSANGEYLFDGDLYQVASRQLVNLTEQQQAQGRKSLMAELNPAEMIVFSPIAPLVAKTYITVYTDVDCGYCQKLHQEVPELNARGIEVRYMAFPRAGVGSATYKKLVSAWCAPNKQDALTRLKNRQAVPELSCDNPVAKQYDLGKRMGINGTPAILLKDGTLIPGYRPAADLAKTLGL